MAVITRRLEFDAAHRVMRHESKCRNLHGHRYVVEVTVSGELDSLGRVVDFGVVKDVLGTWIDARLDHGAILNQEDEALVWFCRSHDWKVYVMGCNPTAENIASEILGVASRLLSDDLSVGRVRVRETPNCWADAFR